MVEATCYVASRVRDVPVPAVPSVERHCSLCRVMVWVDVRTVREAEGLRLICARCFLVEVGGG